MAKKGFFSWFRKDKPQEEVAAEPEVDSELSEEQLEDETVAESTEQVELDASADNTVEQLEETEDADLPAIEDMAEEELDAETEAGSDESEDAPKSESPEDDVIGLLDEDEDEIEVEAVAVVEPRAETEVTVVEDEDDEDEIVVIETSEVDVVEAEDIEIDDVEADVIEPDDGQILDDQDVETAESVTEDDEESDIDSEDEDDIDGETEAEEDRATEVTDIQPEPQARPGKEGFFARLRRGLLRTSENIGSGFFGLFKGKKIDDDLFDELEEQLLIADVGVETTSRLIKSLTEHASRKQLKNAEALYDLLRDEMEKTIEPVSIPLIPENPDGPFVILMVGVNGVGKTTTIGKLAKQYQAEGKSVMLAAGDTFRAAAVEQLQVWGQRNDVPVIAQHTGADSASVLFDALQAAKARNIDVLIADTAGRLQNKAHLMEELKKVVRVMKKQDETAPHEVMLTLDASTGQNAISQAQLFQQAVGVTGITITKLDGTAKGGVIFAIADKFGIPIRHIGVGEQIDDLREFEAKGFIEALFSHEK